MFSAIAAVVIATAPPAEDSKNIALSTAILDRVGDRLWAGWSQTPFPIDLLTTNGPVEINFAKPIPAPSFPPQLEATFPFSNGVPTIVIGEPQFTEAKTPVRWSVTLLHEHFHQWQDSWPQYFRATKALGLSDGDTSGSWMLDYPFPYGDAAIDRSFSLAAGRLADAVEAIGTPSFDVALRAYISAREAFASSLAPKDYRYFSFQCWQEGVARYTEIMVARLAVQEHERHATFLTEAVAADLAVDADQTESTVLKKLRGGALAADKRESFYAYGAAEALVLDAAAPDWRDTYLNPKMDLSTYLPGK